MIDFITDNFEPSSEAFWKQKIQFELDGADYSKTFITKTNEGVSIKPFYHADSFEKINTPHPKEPFKTCHTIVVSNETNSNLEALNLINKGTKALKFIIETPINNQLLFKNLLNKEIDFQFEFSFLDLDFLEILIDFLKNEATYLNIDIIGNLAKTGNWFQNLNADFKTIEKLLKNKNTSCILTINANLYQNAGANITQQIAYSLAHVNEYLTNFGGDIASKIQFNFAAGNNFFFEIAKIRAFRYLYNLILSQYNTTTEAKIYSEPSLRNKTIFNKKLNTYRATSENISAVMGGANTISSSSLENFQINNNIYSNIASDSYYIEFLTKQLAEKALIIFKDIEKSGGFLSQLKQGTIQRKIKENAQKELTQLNAKELTLTGANPKVIDKANIDLTLKSQKRVARKTLIIPIITGRLAEKMEQKRLKNEA